MRRVALARSLAVILLPVLAGCAGNPYALQQQNKTLQQQQLALQQRNQELQSRATTLDQDNQELQTMVAQTRQQSKLMEDQLAAVREQLSTTAAQLAQVRDEKQLTDKQTEALMASTRRRVGATIKANNSLQQSLPAITIPGVEVRPDGDVVRIELPATRLFQPNGVVLNASAGLLIDNVLNELSRAYPDQILGIEGHTDNTYPAGAQPGSSQQISVGRAMAVYQYLTTRSRIAPQRLFVVGHGSNHPAVSNATPAGQARNNRVEIVVYPDKPAAAQ